MIMQAGRVFEHPASPDHRTAVEGRTMADNSNSTNLEPARADDWPHVCEMLAIAMIERMSGHNGEALRYLDEAAIIFNRMLGHEPVPKRTRGRPRFQSDPDESALDQMDYWAKKTGEHRAWTLARRIADINPAWKPDSAESKLRDPTRYALREHCWACFHVSANGTKEACIRRLATKWKARNGY
jgi:hypothetical protein